MFIDYHFLMTGKRHRATAREGAATNEPERKKKKKKSVIEPTTEAQYAVISNILGFFVMKNEPTNKLFAFSTYSLTTLPFFAFPVLTRPGESSGRLPDPLPSGDIGYFLGAADPSDVKTAIVEAYVKTHPGVSTKCQPWKNWEVYRINSAYYGQTVFEKSGHQDIEDLKNEILGTREWGGKENRLMVPFARVFKQKKYDRNAVYLVDYFAGKAPTGLNVLPDSTAVFQTREVLVEHGRRYTERLKREAELAKNKLKKALNDASEESSSEEDDEEENTDNENE